MAFKNAEYDIGGNNIHFETNAGQVRITNSSKTDLGSLLELYFEGKTIDGATISDIKTSGIYKGKNMVGLPEGIPADKTAILQVTAVGKAGAPDMIHYTVIGANGTVKDKAVGVGVTGDWTSGGTELKDKLSSLTSQVGSLSSLKTSTKANVVEAINEILAKKGEGIVLTNNVPLKMRKTDGSEVEAIKIGADNNVYVGNGSTHMDLSSANGLTINGSTAVTTANYGSGKDLDADTVDGEHANQFAKLDRSNALHGDQYILDGHDFVMRGDGNGGVGAIDGQLADGTTLGKIVFEKDGTFHVENNGMKSLVLQNNGNANLFGSVSIIQRGTWDPEIALNNGTYGDWANGFAIRRNSNDGDIRFYRRSDGFDFMYLGWKNGDVRFNAPIIIQGRKLFLQGGQPNDNVGIPEGSIWIS